MTRTPQIFNLDNSPCYTLRRSHGYRLKADGYLNLLPTTILTRSICNYIVLLVKYPFSRRFYASHTILNLFWVVTCRIIIIEYKQYIGFFFFVFLSSIRCKYKNTNFVRLFLLSLMRFYIGTCLLLITYYVICFWALACIFEINKTPMQ